MPSPRVAPTLRPVAEAVAAANALSPSTARGESVWSKSGGTSVGKRGIRLGGDAGSSE
jgi:hypothetical protein